eukprot:TRINITY_DN117_c0_g2_i1.p1 TRINITY_DN117_c0_g2~~TRINITY_DN117_c0_g2_i1.p1  ORF type:complete len:678 (-),score=77.38 TRINITY_DN117_c0_g2_i1:530-2563(-)
MGHPLSRVQDLDHETSVSAVKKQRGLLYQDSKNVIRVQGAFWEKVKNEIESIDEGSVTSDLIEAGKGSWESFKEMIPEEESEGLMKNVIQTVFGAPGVDDLIKLGKELPWISTFIQMGSIIYLGAQEAKENQENCDRLGKAIQAVMMIVVNTDKQRLQQMCEASDKLNQILKEGFEKYLSLGIALIARFTQRSNLMKFLMRSHDKQDFEGVYQGLMSSVTLLNFSMSMLPNDILDKVDTHDANFENFTNDLMQGDQDLNSVWNDESDKVKIKLQGNQGKLAQFSDKYTEQRTKAEDILSDLGQGDTSEGLRVLSEYIQSRKSNKCNPDERIESVIQQLEDTLPVHIDSQIDLQQGSVDILNQFRSMNLPESLSLQIKKFWAAKIGASKKSAEWEEFRRAVEEGHYTFLNSQEVRNKELALEVEQYGLTRYILKNMIDKNAEGEVRGPELREFYEWCNNKWQSEPSKSRGNPPRTIGDLIRTLYKYMEDAKSYIEQQQTLDYYNKAIDWNRIKCSVFQNNEHRLKTIRILQLSFNGLGDRGATIAFSCMEETMPNLRELEMEECRLEYPKGVEKIIPKLEVLLLGGNKLGDNNNRGLELISKGLRNKQSDDSGIVLKVLDLENNGITQVNTIITVLIEGDCDVDEINLNRNQLDSDMVAAVEDLADIGITVFADDQEP